MVEIKEIISKEEWERFISRVKPPTFLQSWNWGEFNKKLGSKIWRLGVTSDGGLTGVAFVTRVQARRGSFLLCPHGPIVREADRSQITNHKLQTVTELVGYLKQLAREEGCSFIRISSSFLKSPDNEKLFRDLGFRPSPIHTHAEIVWLLNLKTSEEEILANMRKQTRYSIKKAQKDGVKIIQSKNISDFANFWSIYETTAQEKHFIPFSKNYLIKEFEVFSRDNEVLFLSAKYKEEIVATAMIIFTPWSAFYHHGASLKKHHQLTASHLLQWEVIREAKKRGCQVYNFWGIAPLDSKNHPWAGLSLFKRGFGGFIQEFVPSHDLSLSPKYAFTYSIEKLRKFRRGF